MAEDDEEPMHAIDTRPVVVARYHDEISAQLAAVVLESNGVPSQVMADTGGGMLPSMAVVFPVRLLVRAQDESLARELLAEPNESA